MTPKLFVHSAPHPLDMTAIFIPIFMLYFLIISGVRRDGEGAQTSQTTGRDENEKFTN